MPCALWKIVISISSFQRGFKFKIAIAALLGSAACTTADTGTMGVASSSATGITISTVDLGVVGTDEAYSVAGRLAAAHCATVGKTATFASRDPVCGLTPDTITYTCD